MTSRGGPVRAAGLVAGGALFGLAASPLIGLGETAGKVTGVVALGLVVPLAWRWWHIWKAYARAGYFAPYVATFSMANNDLSLSLAEPLHFYGIRCDVRRTSRPGLCVAESVEEGIYGHPGCPPPTFAYPLRFSPGRKALQLGELCKACWYVRDKKDGGWLFVAENDFHFGSSEMRTATS